MKFITSHIAEHLDVVASETDLIDVRVEDSATGQVLYVDVNGITIVRIGHIQKQVEFKDNDKKTKD